MFLVELFIHQPCSTEMKRTVDNLEPISWIFHYISEVQDISDRFILEIMFCLGSHHKQLPYWRPYNNSDYFFIYFSSFISSLFPKDLLFFIVFFATLFMICVESHKFIFMLDFALIQCWMNPLAALTFWILTIWFWMILYGWMKSMAYLLLLPILRDVKLLASIVSGSLIMRKAVGQIRWILN